MEEAPEITEVDENNNKEDEYDIKHEHPQDEYVTKRDDMDEYVEPNKQQDDQEYYGEHESHQSNNTNKNINMP